MTEIPKHEVEKIVAICNTLELEFKVQENEIKIDQFEYGLFSSIYRITFLISTPNSIPQSVVIKLYPIDKNESEVGYDIQASQLNSLIIGQSGLGPSVLLIKPEAIVLEYIHSRTLTLQDDLNPQFREKIAVKLAQFHSVKVPITRNDHKEHVKYVFNTWLSKELVKSVYSGHVGLILNKLKLTHILENDLRMEANYVRDSILKRDDMSLVFSHRDFNHANILVELSGANEGDIRLIDFDYSYYFYRGIDLGRYFSDCTQPSFWHNYDLISDQMMLEFIEFYRQECGKIHGENYLKSPNNSAKQLLSETKLFVLYVYWTDILISLTLVNNSQDTNIQKEHAINADTRFNGYLKVKTRFQGDGSIPK